MWYIREGRISPVQIILLYLQPKTHGILNIPWESSLGSCFWRKHKFETNSHKQQPFKGFLKINYNTILSAKQEARQNNYVTSPLSQTDGHKDFAVYFATPIEQVKTKWWPPLSSWGVPWHVCKDLSHTDWMLCAPVRLTLHCPGGGWPQGLAVMYSSSLLLLTSCWETIFSPWKLKTPKSKIAFTLL